MSPSSQLPDPSASPLVNREVILQDCFQGALMGSLAGAVAGGLPPEQLDSLWASLQQGAIALRSHPPAIPPVPSAVPVEILLSRLPALLLVHDDENSRRLLGQTWFIPQAEPDAAPDAEPEIAHLAAAGEWLAEAIAALLCNTPFPSPPPALALDPALNPALNLALNPDAVDLPSPCQSLGVELCQARDRFCTYPEQWDLCLQHPTADFQPPPSSLTPTLLGLWFGAAQGIRSLPFQAQQPLLALQQPIQHLAIELFSRWAGCNEFQEVGVSWGGVPSSTSASPSVLGCAPRGR